MPTADDGSADRTHIDTALRLLVIQTILGLGAGGILTGVLPAATHLGLSGALFVAGVVVAQPLDRLKSRRPSAQGRNMRV